MKSKIVLEGLRFSLVCVFCMMMNLSLTAQDAKQVKGKVSDSDGEPLPGVTVVERGTSNGAVTDIDGNYSVTVPADCILQFSFVGMTTQEVPVEGKSTINVTMQADVIGLEEVIAVGYGTQKKADLTGSVSQIGGEKLLAAPTPNLSTALTGKMTGVITRQTSGQPGEDNATFYIRGKSTFGNNSALVLVDGIERDFKRIDPNEIESVTILKDAASAAIYGARAANGVILITTKRGGNMEPSVTYTGTFGVQSPTFKPEMMDAGQFARYFSEASANQGDLPPFTNEQIQQYENGTLPHTDWWGEVMDDTAPIQQHNISINGGTKKTKFFVSLGYLDQGGLYDLAWLKKYSVRSNIDTEITKDLKLSLDIAARQEKDSESPDEAWNLLLNSQPTVRPYVPDHIEPGGLHYNGTNVSPIGRALHSGYEEDKRSIFQSTLSAQYSFPFIKGLNAKFSFSYDQTDSKNKEWKLPYTFYVYDEANDIADEFQSLSKISLSQRSAEWNQKTLQASLNYDRTFGEHNVSGVFVYEQAEISSDNIWAYREQFLSDAIDQLFAGSNINKDNNGSAYETARKGYVGRVGYNYKGKYYAQVNARYDGSYNFPDEGRWGLFPAFSFGWRMSDESFMENVEWLDNLKFRASWGQYGNDRISAYQYLSGFAFNNGKGMILGDGNLSQAIRETSLANPDITWETATSSNIGFEYAILNGKISGEFDYFNKRTEDILMYRNASVPQTFGASLPRENLGIVENNGFEAILRYNEQIGEFRFNIEGNVTFAKSEVIEIDEPVDVPDRLKRTGLPFDQFFGLEAMGLFTSQSEIDSWAIQDNNDNSSIQTGDIKYVDYSGPDGEPDGVIDGYDIHQIGRSQIPELVYGFNLSANFRNWDLTANFQGASRYDQYTFIDGFGLKSNSMAVLTDAYHENNPDGKYPRQYVGQKPNNKEFSSFWLNKGNYLKLRNVELAYTLVDINFLNSVGIDHVRLSVSGNNVLTLAKYKVFDPERPYKSGNPLYYPQMKTWNFGVNVKF
ncbi:TonB-dependent receptor [uncultured Draconibacterium sp.]|uniref:SusC/RagA family TonB-linked outer membrane protein n=1 Tax=uncultured Draconibacterium sp. TaxID=1573823 RepID=UPI0032616C54